MKIYEKKNKSNLVRKSVKPKEKNLENASNTERSLHHLKKFISNKFKYFYSKIFKILYILIFLFNIYKNLAFSSKFSSLDLEINKEMFTLLNGRYRGDIFFIAANDSTTGLFSHIFPKNILTSIFCNRPLGNNLLASKKSILHGLFSNFLFNKNISFNECLFWIFYVNSESKLVPLRKELSYKDPRHCIGLSVDQIIDNSNISVNGQVMTVADYLMKEKKIIFFFKSANPYTNFLVDKYFQKYKYYNYRLSLNQFLNGYIFKKAILIYNLIRDYDQYSKREATWGFKYIFDKIFSYGLINIDSMTGHRITRELIKVKEDRYLEVIDVREFFVKQRVIDLRDEQFNQRVQEHDNFKLDSKKGSNKNMIRNLDKDLEKSKEMGIYNLMKTAIERSLADYKSIAKFQIDLSNSLFKILYNLEVLKYSFDDKCREEDKALYLELLSLLTKNIIFVYRDQRFYGPIMTVNFGFDLRNLLQEFKYEAVDYEKVNKLIERDGGIYVMSYDNVIY